MSPIAIEIGPFAIRWYAICIILGVAIAVRLAMHEAPRRKIRPDDILDFILIAFPTAIIGARLYYVAFSWDEYKDNLLELFAIWHGGLAIYGGLLAGFLVLCLFTRYRFIATMDFLDVAAPSVMIAQSIGRWGNFFNQEAYGAAVDNLRHLPQFIQNQMYIDGSYRQPTFLYESVWNLLGFILICLIRRKKRFLKRGDVLSFYLIWYGVGRFFIEGLRTDSLMVAGLRVSQCLSIALVFVGFVLVIYHRKKADTPYYQP